MDQSVYATSQPYQPSAAELGGWNWGAFWFTWIWGVNHKAYITLLVLIPFVNIVIPIIAGIKGNQWAWESGRFQTVQEMRACQSIWAKWALAGFLLGIVLGIVILIAMAAGGGPQY